MSFSFDNTDDAARAILGETCRILNQEGIDYVIVGGWVVKLLHSDPLVRQGTFDLDILLNDKMKRTAVEDAAKALKKSGYIPPAKNPFQLYKALRVKDQLVMYHLDFLHKLYANPDNDIFIDWGQLQSIPGPGTDIIFEHREVRNQPVVYLDKDGSPASCNIPLCTELGILSSKSRSLNAQRREKDAYDLFLVLKQSTDYQDVISKSKKYLSNSIFMKSIKNLRRHFEKYLLVENATRFLLKNNAGIPDARALVEETFQKYLADIGMTSRARKAPPGT